MFLDSTLPPSQIDVYLGTEYVVHASRASPTFTLRAGQRSRDLSALLLRYRATAAAFLTAWNPQSLPLEQDLNRLRQSDLAGLLEAAGLAHLSGIGRDPSGQWPGEESFLVMGIERSMADGLARRFGQNAYLWCKADGWAELVLMH